MVPTSSAVEGVVVSVSVNPWNRLRPLLNNRKELSYQTYLSQKKVDFGNLWVKVSKKVNYIF